MLEDFSVSSFRSSTIYNYFNISEFIPEPRPLNEDYSFVGQYYISVTESK